MMNKPMKAVPKSTALIVWRFCNGRFCTNAGRPRISLVEDWLAMLLRLKEYVGPSMDVSRWSCELAQWRYFGSMYNALLWVEFRPHSP